MTQTHWQAVARSRDLRHKPLQIMYESRPVVLFRTSGGIAALHDRCPHRLVELSKGRVTDDTIECPYHGWRFAADGNCVAIPGCVTPLPKCRVRRYDVMEKEGGVFLTTGTPDSPPHAHVMEGQRCIMRVVQSSTRSTLVDAAENILDATHTHFTHKGLLRGISAKRYRVSVAVTAGDDWVQASYKGEDRQLGLVSRLLEGGRIETIGRYRHPGIAELEYWGPNGLVLGTTFHLRQADAETVEGIGWLVGPRKTWVDHVKALAFQPMFKIALEQDRHVLQSAFDNAQGARPMIGPLDFLRTAIEAIAAGQRPPQETRRYEMEL